MKLTMQNIRIILERKLLVNIPFCALVSSLGAEVALARPAACTGISSQTPDITSLRKPLPLQHASSHSSNHPPAGTILYSHPFVHHQVHVSSHSINT